VGCFCFFNCKDCGGLLQNNHFHRTSLQDRFSFRSFFIFTSETRSCFRAWPLFNLFLRSERILRLSLITLGCTGGSSAFIWISTNTAYARRKEVVTKIEVKIIEDWRKHKFCTYKLFYILDNLTDLFPKEKYSSLIIFLFCLVNEFPLSCGIVLRPEYNAQTVASADCGYVFTTEPYKILDLEMNTTGFTNFSILHVSLWITTENFN